MLVIYEMDSWNGQYLKMSIFRIVNMSNKNYLIKLQNHSLTVILENYSFSSMTYKLVKSNKSDGLRKSKKKTTRTFSDAVCNVNGRKFRRMVISPVDIPS